MLEAACGINPDTGHTELGRFLEMTGGLVTRVTNEATGEVYPDEESALADVSVYDQDGAPVFFVEHDKPPHSEHTIILSLIEEIRRLRFTIDGKLRITGSYRPERFTTTEPKEDT